VGGERLAGGTDVVFAATGCLNAGPTMAAFYLMVEERSMGGEGQTTASAIWGSLWRR
jgi:hypothetical protein